MMRLGAGLVLGATLFVGSCAVNPVTGESELSLVSAAQELALGDEMHPSVIYEYDGEYRDPELKRYLGTIVKRIHKVSHRADEPVDFKVLNSSIFNAFAIPGHVYVTRGFLAKLRNEAEFAAVMGHEIAHYTARHSASKLSQAQLMQAGAGLLGAVDQTVGQIGLVGLNLASLRYGRSQEEQADRVGTYYLYRAGYEPTRALDMQKLLHSIGGKSEETSPFAEYMSTHPTEERRLARIETVIKEFKLDDGRYLQGDGTFEARWQRRLKSLRDAQPAFDRADKAQAALKQGNAKQALTLAREAIELRPNEAPFFRLLGDSLQGQGQLPEAKAAYQRALSIDPRYVFAKQGLAAASYAERDYRGAASYFREVLQLLPDSPGALYGLGASLFNQKDYPGARPYLESVGQAGHPGALAYLGQTYEALGDPDRAAAAYRACVEAADENWKKTSLVQLAEKRLSSMPEPKQD